MIEEFLNAIRSWETEYQMSFDAVGLEDSENKRKCFCQRGHIDQGWRQKNASRKEGEYAKVKLM